MDYKETLLLPKTTFPMRGNLPQNEKIRYDEWFKEDVYSTMKKKREGRESYTLHDGPPYANGHIHIGHALNKVLKDMIVKFNYFQGKDVRYVPGWDCHGLPIEQQVEKKLGKEKKESLPKSKIRELCREHAAKFIDIQKGEFQTLGILADWNNPYKTMDFKFEANIYRELTKIAQKGLLVERSKPVFWCSHDKTALAEAEVEYEDKIDYSIFVNFSLSQEALSSLDIEKAGVVIWTTTPWTLPSNVAISLNPHEIYALSSDHKIVVKELYDSLREQGVVEGEIVREFEASALENLMAKNPLNGRDSKVILGEHVTLDSGSGCVHTAPGHGEDDYRVGLNYDLDVLMPVDEAGSYDQTLKREGLLPESFIGMSIFEANEKIVELLGEACVKVDKFSHSYPHCWRCHNPLIYRATKQWFIAMDKEVESETLRNIGLEELKNVTFFPASGRNRLNTMIENRPDWCISRQRDWGVPIAFFRDKESGEVIFDKEVLDHVASIFEEKGCDAWYDLDADALLPENSPHKTKNLEKVNDILDVWFDSGSTFAAVLQSGNYDAGSYPADLYLEGSDQHRGWFQSSLLVSTSTNAKSPYKTILTHGFTVDEKGEKMSKSKGNVVSPHDVVKKQGSEILRLWVAMSDYRSDIKISDNILKQIAEQYRKLRNTIRFLLANIDDLETLSDVSEFSFLDRWIMAKTSQVFEEIIHAFTVYDFSKAFNILNNFIVNELSAIYLDVCKDRLYCDTKNGVKRRASQSAMAMIAERLLALIAPVLTYTADEANRHAPAIIKKESIFDFEYRALPHIQNPLGPLVLEARDKFYEMVDTLKKEKKIKSTLELVIDTNFEALLQEEMADFFVVSEMVNDSDGEKLATFHVDSFVCQIKRATKHKCPRCWKFVSEKEETACNRCAEVVDV